MLHHHKVLRLSEGSSTVEMAIVVTLFFGLVFAIIEFALAVFYANRLIDATRAGARYAVVSAPLLSDISTYNCSSLPSDYSACDGSNDACSALAKIMNATVVIPVENIYYRYQCTTISSESTSKVYSLSIKVSGMKYVPILPNLLVMNNPDSDNVVLAINMPGFETTRTSEDQFGK